MLSAKIMFHFPPNTFFPPNKRIHYRAFTENGESIAPDRFSGIAFQSPAAVSGVISATDITRFNLSRSWMRTRDVSACTKCWILLSSISLIDFAIRAAASRFWSMKLARLTWTAVARYALRLGTSGTRIMTPWVMYCAFFVGFRESNPVDIWESAY